MANDIQFAGQKEPLRIDSQGRAMCTAHARTTGEACKSPAMHGQRVCRMHGGSNPQARRNAKLRLAEMVDPALTVLSDTMASEDVGASERLAAANSVLDRAGHGRTSRIETTDARELLIESLIALRGESSEE